MADANRQVLEQQWNQLHSNSVLNFLFDRPVLLNALDIPPALPRRKIWFGIGCHQINTPATDDWQGWAELRFFVNRNEVGRLYKRFGSNSMLTSADTDWCAWKEEGGPLPDMIIGTLVANAERFKISGQEMFINADRVEFWQTLMSSPASSEWTRLIRIISSV